MKIKVIDSFCTGYVHNKFNAAFLTMLITLKYDLSIYMSKSAKKNLLNILGDESSINNSHTIYVKEGEGRWNVLFRYLVGAIINLYQLSRSKKEEIVLYNFNNPFSLYLLNAINFFYNRKIIILCHGEMEQLIPGKKSGGYLYRLIGVLLRSFFYTERFHHDSIYYCVISKSVLNNILEILPPSVSRKFYQFELPYLYSAPGIYNSKNIRNSMGQLSIGTVGTFNEKRGAKMFVSLAKRVVSNKNIHLSVTGKIQWGNRELNELNISLPSDGGKGMVGVEEFNKRINKLDYILYLYPSDSYKLIASAAVMDAIDLRKPILAIRNNYFEHLFSIYGEFGVLVKDIDEMVQVINLLQQNRLSIQVDFDKIQKLSSPQTISKQFEEVVNAILLR